jgi:hypothetical protein
MKPNLKILPLVAMLALPCFADAPQAAFNNFNDWIGSEATGVRIGADGKLRLAPGLRKVAAISEGVIWAAVPDGQGGAFLSAGTEGKLFRYSGGTVKPLAQVKGGIVFAMARLGGDLIVAPSNEGKLLRVTAGGEVKPFADIDLKAVWAMVSQGNELYLAGSGEKGAAVVLARDGGSRRLVEVPEESAFASICSDGQGGWLLGTHGRGLLMRLVGSGGSEHLETLMDTPFEEIRALAVHDGDIYIGASNGLTSRFASGVLEKREAYTAEGSGTSKGAVFRLGRDLVPETLWQSAQSQVFALTVWRGQMLVGTGNRARIFGLPLTAKARDLDPFAALQDLGTAQASAFLASGTDLMVVGSNPAELHLLSETQALEGTLESKVLKAQPLGDWGRAYVEADTPQGTNVDLQVRTGSTETPDSTWSTWTPPLRSGERPNVKPARFAQFRLRLSSSRGGASPVVEEVRIHWHNRNLAPIWEGVDIMPPGLTITRNAPPDDIGIERVPFETQKLIPAMAYSGSERRSFRRGAQSFTFKVSDPNGDQLNYRLKLLPDHGAPFELEKGWKDKFFSFDTLPVPDGRYRLEATATDAPSQAFNAALTASWRTAPFLVDHTPPFITDLTAVSEGEGVRVRFTAKDGGSTIKEATLSADGEKWLQVLPEDRIFDQRDERFEVLVPRDLIKGDRVLVRVTDTHLNEQAQSVAIGSVGKR